MPQQQGRQAFSDIMIVRHMLLFIIFIGIIISIIRTASEEPSFFLPAPDSKYRYACYSGFWSTILEYICWGPVP